MRIIVEAGGTKCKWGLTGSRTRTIETIGFNPNCGHTDGLLGIAQAVAEVAENEVESVLYFGAGCGNRQNQELVRDTLYKVFANAQIKVCSDLEGAATALFGQEQGIAAVLGTGASAGVYNGSEIIQQAPSLGYLLGDEGSGAYLGKTLIQKVLRRELSDDICRKFWDFAKSTPSELIHNIYMSATANSLLASYVPFLSENVDSEQIKSLVTNGIAKFDQKHIKILNLTDLPLGFVGGIAFQFSDMLKHHFSNQGFDIKILKDAYSELIKSAN
ncbi:MAG: hypothetical protein J6T12_09885 [Salinivirgaceae bacterium]|nr:hypothetical protein [Salinivirgaceae bacterium]